MGGQIVGTCIVQVSRFGLDRPRPEGHRFRCAKVPFDTLPTRRESRSPAGCSQSGAAVSLFHNHGLRIRDNVAAVIIWQIRGSDQLSMRTVVPSYCGVSK
jgi:hypothetical protein